LLICATSAFGLESALKAEMRKLGYQPAFFSEGCFSVEGGWPDVLRLNIHLRTASRVMLPLARGPAGSFDELYELAKSIDWEAYLPSSGRLDVTRVSLSRSQLASKADCQRIVKKAAMDRLTSHYSLKRMPETGAAYPASLDIANDIANIFLNTSGPSLHRRGYCLMRGLAPLKETLAAGMLLLAGYDGTQEFADVMCGSGTIAIEAALIATGRPAGLNREFAMQGWGVLSGLAQSQIYEEAISSIRKPAYRVLASDIDPKVLKSARENASRAEVGDVAQFQAMDLKDFRSRKKRGLILTNPPYGERIGNYKEAASTARALGALYQNLDGWDVFALSAFDGFEKAFGKKADTNRKLYSGGMRTYLYGYKSAASVDH